MEYIRQVVLQIHAEASVLWCDLVSGWYDYVFGVCEQREQVVVALVARVFGRRVNVDYWRTTNVRKQHKTKLPSKSSNTSKIRAFIEKCWSYTFV